MDKFTSPVFVLCPRKPHSKGNRYHDICCGEIFIICGCEIVQVRDRPIPMGRPKFDTSHNMQTLGLMLQKTRSLWSTGKAAIIKISFCVLKRLL